MPKKKTEEKEKKPEKDTKKEITLAEFEKKVLALSKEGLTSEKIGEALKHERIHSRDYKKKISQILKEKGEYVDPDLKNVEEKLTRLEKHVEKNGQDKRAVRERSRVFSQIRKLKKYRGIKLK